MFRIERIVPVIFVYMASVVDCEIGVILVQSDVFAFGMCNDNSPNNLNRVLSLDGTITFKDVSVLRSNLCRDLKRA